VSTRHGSLTAPRVPTGSGRRCRRRATRVVARVVPRRRGPRRRRPQLVRGRCQRRAASRSSRRARHRIQPSPTAHRRGRPPGCRHQASQRPSSDPSAGRRRRGRRRARGQQRHDRHPGAAGEQRELTVVRRDHRRPSPRAQERTRSVRAPRGSEDAIAVDHHRERGVRDQPADGCDRRLLTPETRDRPRAHRTGRGRRAPRCGSRLQESCAE
jgi:hypothetical protein